MNERTQGHLTGMAISLVIVVIFAWGMAKWGTVERPVKTPAELDAYCAEVATASRAKLAFSIRRLEQHHIPILLACALGQPETPASGN